MAVIKVYPGTVAEDSTSGTIAWGDISNVSSSNNTGAVAELLGGESTKNIKCTNFGLAIGADKRITGIRVGIEHTNTATQLPTTRNLYAKLVLAGTIGDEEKSNVLPLTGYSGSEITTTLGGDTDTWSIADLDYNDVNASTFGVVVRLEMEAE